MRQLLVRRACLCRARVTLDDRAFSAVEAMSDRYCVAGIAANLSISAQQMNSCCDSCGSGCDGGYPPQAWQYWVDTGVREIA